MNAERAIANLIAEYAERMDAGDLEGVAALLARAAVGSGAGDATGGEEGIGEDPASSPGLATGQDALHRLFASTVHLYPDGTPRTKHITTNLILEIDEEAGTASARSYWTVLQAAAGLPLQPILAGRYQDRFARSAGVWHFTERRYLVDLVGDTGHHLRPTGPTLRP